VPTYRTTRRVRHSPAQMFDLVADVEKYPLFVPLCESLHIRRRAQSGEGVEVLLADMSVGFKAIHETFGSRVTLDRPRLKILVEYVDGPFSDLQNRWSFQPDAVGCLVEFYIAYEFRSRTLGLLMGTMFDRAFRKFAEAFEQRANDVYGAPGAAVLPNQA
jgi:coenzyme Q-binding protein COQ10